MLNSSQKGIAHIFLILILLIAGIGLGIYLVQNKTNLLPWAASNPISPKTAFTLSSNAQQVTPSGEFSVNVLANSDFDAANLFTLVMNYPTDKVEVVGVTPSDATPSATFVKKWIERSVNNGKVTLSGAVPNPGLKTTAGAPQTMATIIFRVHAKSGEIPLVVNSDSAIYRNSDNQNIIGNNIGVTVKIGSTPSVTPSPNNECRSIGCAPPPAGCNYVGGFTSTCNLAEYGKLTCGNLVCNGSPVPDSCATSSTKVPQVISNSEVVWTYTFNNTKIIKASFKATPGVLWKAHGRQTSPGAALDVVLPGGVNPFIFSATVSQACQAFTGSFTLTNSCNIPINSFVGMGSAAAWGNVCQSPTPLPTPTPTPIQTPTPTPTSTPRPVDPKRADLYKDSAKPNFVNDQDISVFFTKCAEAGAEIFGKPASVQPVCDINNDGTINTPDWSILIKFRNQPV